MAHHFSRKIRPLAIVALGLAVGVALLPAAARAQAAAPGAPAPGAPAVKPEMAESCPGLVATDTPP